MSNSRGGKDGKEGIYGSAGLGAGNEDSRNVYGGAPGLNDNYGEAPNQYGAGTAPQNPNIGPTSLPPNPDQTAVPDQSAGNVGNQGEEDMQLATPSVSPAGSPRGGDQRRISGEVAAARGDGSSSIPGNPNSMQRPSDSSSKDTPEPPKPSR